MTFERGKNDWGDAFSIDPVNISTMVNQHASNVCKAVPGCIGEGGICVINPSWTIPSWSSDRTSSRLSANVASISGGREICGGEICGGEEVGVDTGAGGETGAFDERVVRSHPMSPM